MMKAYLRSMLPAVLAFAFSGVYAIVDGFLSDSILATVVLQVSISPIP